MDTRSGKERLAALVSGVALSAASLLPAGSVRASTDLTRLGTDRSTQWYEIETSQNDYCIEISDATIYMTTGDTRGDAFDGALILAVDNGTDVDDFEFTADAAVVDYGATTDASVSGSCAATVSGQDLQQKSNSCSTVTKGWSQERPS